MGNSGKNSNTSQFFITLSDVSKLTGKHVGFGKVIADHMLKVRKSEEPWCVCVRACVVVREGGGERGRERACGCTAAKPAERRALWSPALSVHAAVAVAPAAVLRRSARSRVGLPRCSSAGRPLGRCERALT